MEPSETFVEVLRHAKACSREAWDGDDRSRPLDDAGWAQAKRLLRDLTAVPVTAIYSSPAVRCTQTVEALAATVGLPITTDPRLEELRTPPVTDGGDPWPSIAWLGSRALTLLDEAVTARHGERIVICSHGDVLGTMLAALAARDALPLHDVALKKSARFTLGFDAAGRCRAVERHPPMPKDP